MLQPTHDPARGQPEGNLPKPARRLPHGLLKPPAEVLDALARERAKFPPEVYTAEVAERTLNDWTVDYLFGHQLGYHDDVLYRPTPEGPAVVGVGRLEILDLTQDMPAEERARLRTWSPS